MKKILTCNEFAKLSGLDYQVASGFLKALKHFGLVSEVGSRPAVGGKGKPSTLLEIPQSISLQLFKAEEIAA